MQITRIETFLVHPDHRNLVFVKVHTDEGIHGIGEAYSCGPDRATEAAIHDFEEWLVGRDPMNVEGLWQLMYIGSRFPGGSVVNAAISGIDHALWDIAGKHLGVPVWQLLGGKVRERVRVYQNPGGSTPEELGERALALRERYGYTAFKIGPQPPGSERLPWNRVVREATARMEGIRRAVGDDIEIGVDPHAKIFEPARALMLAEALKPFKPFFYEEPLRPENIDALAAFKARCPIPVATGEMLYTKHEFRDLLARNGADIIQPDVCLMGGLSEIKKVAAMAEAHYVAVAPHNPMGPVATAVNVHFAIATHNFLVLEYIPDDQPPRRDLVQEPLEVKAGYIEAPTKPGLGIELNEAAFGKYPHRTWHRGFPWREDGSLGFI